MIQKDASTYLHRAPSLINTAQVGTHHNRTIFDAHFIDRLVSHNVAKKIQQPRHQISLAKFLLKSIKLD